MSDVIGNPDSCRLLPQAALCLRHILIRPWTGPVWREAEKDYDCNILKSNLFAWPETSTLHNCFLPTKSLILCCQEAAGSRQDSAPTLVQAFQSVGKCPLEGPAPGKAMGGDRVVGLVEAAVSVHFVSICPILVRGAAPH